MPVIPLILSLYNTKTNIIMLNFQYNCTDVFTLLLSVSKEQKLVYINSLLNQTTRDLKCSSEFFMALKIFWGAMPET